MSTPAAGSDQTLVGAAQSANLELQPCSLSYPFALVMPWPSRCPYAVLPTVVCERLCFDSDEVYGLYGYVGYEIDLQFKRVNPLWGWAQAI